MNTKMDFILKLLKKIFIYVFYVISILISAYIFYIAHIKPELFYSNSVIIGLFIYITISIWLVDILIKKKNKNKKFKISILVLLFISIDLIFASLYYKVYTQTPSNFNVSSSIHNGKMLNEYDKEFESLLKSNRLLLLLSQMQTNLDTTLYAIKSFNNRKTLSGVFIPYYGSKHKLDDYYYFQFSIFFIMIGDHGDETCQIIFSNKKNEKTYLSDDQFIEYSGEYIIHGMLKVKNKYELFLFIDKIIKQLRTVRNTQLKSLNKIIYKNANLGFLDFFYFSTITITTTGYGDITPNSRIVRIIVSIQTLFGILFIAFALLLFTEKNEKNSPKNLKEVLISWIKVFFRWIIKLFS